MCLASESMTYAKNNTTITTSHVDSGRLDSMAPTNGACPSGKANTFRATLAAESRKLLFVVGHKLGAIHRYKAKEKPISTPGCAENSINQTNESTITENNKAGEKTFLRRRLSVSESPQFDPHNADDGADEVCHPHKGALSNRRPRISVCGAVAKTRQDNFANKRQQIKDLSEPELFSTLKTLGIGYACHKGLKPESPNQDDFFILGIETYGLYGVFDGHGPCGHDISNLVQQELPSMILNDPNFATSPKDVLCRAFAEVHRKVIQCASDGSFDCALSGTTATVVLHRNDKLVVAHVGDSRCVLGRLAGGAIQAHDLTIDHKPNTESEQKRIVASGGQVKRLEGDIPYRVFLKGKLYPGLAMSRAIGDTVGTQAGVIAEPDVCEHQIDQACDSFIILASDGMWEFISSEEAVEIVHRYGMEKVQEAADYLARESWQRWITEEGNVVDDITVQIVYLFPSVVTRQAHTVVSTVDT